VPLDEEGRMSGRLDAIGRALALPAAAAVALPVAVGRRVASAAADRLVPALAEALLARLDLDAVARRLDLDALASRLDVDALVDRVDVDRVLARTDVAGLARYIAAEIDLPELLRATSGSVTGELVSGVRDQGVQADVAVARAIDRFLRREGTRRDRAPGPPP
jgi:hypothetical protein